MTVRPVVVSHGRPSGPAGPARGHSVATTTTALRRVLADEIGERLHLTVTDVDDGP